MLDDIHALLDALRLRHARAVVAEAIKAAQKSKPSYSAFLLELLRREHEGQRDRSIANRLKRSGLDEFWTLETFPFISRNASTRRSFTNWPNWTSSLGESPWSSSARPQSGKAVWRRAF